MRKPLLDIPDNLREAIIKKRIKAHLSYCNKKENIKNKRKLDEINILKENIINIEVKNKKNEILTLSKEDYKNPIKIQEILEFTNKYKNKMNFKSYSIEKSMRNNLNKSNNLGDNLTSLYDLNHLAGFKEPNDLSHAKELNNIKDLDKTKVFNELKEVNDLNDKILADNNNFLISPSSNQIDN